MAKKPRLVDTAFEDLKTSLALSKQIDIKTRLIDAQTELDLLLDSLIDCALPKHTVEDLIAKAVTKGLGLSEDKIKELDLSIEVKDATNLKLFSNRTKITLRHAPLLDNE